VTTICLRRPRHLANASALKRLTGRVCNNCTILHYVTKAAVITSPYGRLALLTRYRIVPCSAATESIDTLTPAGRMMMQIVGAFAEFERAMLRERTKAGLESARKEGRVGGRRPKLTPQQQSEIISLVTSGTKTAADAARLFRVHPSTVTRLLAKNRMIGAV